MPILGLGSLESVVGEYFSGTDKALVFGLANSVGTLGLSGRSLGRLIRGSGLSLSNAKLNRIYAATSRVYGSQSKLKSATGEQPLGSGYLPSLYTDQAANYLYHVKISARFHEVPGVTTFQITQLSDVPLTKSQIYDMVLERLQTREFAPTSDHGSLQSVQSIITEGGSMSPTLSPSQI